jgi:hypothetical protein
MIWEGKQIDTKFRSVIAQFDEQAAWLLRAKPRQYARAVPAFVAFTGDWAGSKWSMALSYMGFHPPGNSIASQWILLEAKSNHSN